MEKNQKQKQNQREKGRMNQLLLLYQQYRKQLEMIGVQVELLESTAGEYGRARDTIEEVGNAREGSEILVPIGGNVFIYSTLKDSSRVITGIGGNVAIEKKVDKAIDIIEKRIEDIRKEEKKLGELAQKIQLKLEEISTKIGEKYSKNQNVQIS